MLLYQGFSNLYQNHLVILLKQGPSPQSLIQWSGVELKNLYRASSWVMLMLLIWEPHFENCGSLQYLKPNGSVRGVTEITIWEKKICL